MTAQHTETFRELQKIGLIPQTLSADSSIADNHDDTPWYLQIFLGVSGLLSGLLLIGFFVLLLSSALRDSSTQFIVGTLLIATGFALLLTSRRRGNTFLTSLAFASSIAGQGFFVAALLDLELAVPAIVATILLMQAGLALLMPNFLHRLLNSFVALGCLVYLLSYYHAPEVTAGLLALITAALGLHRYAMLSGVSRKWRPLITELSRAVTYASAFMLLIISVYVIAAEYSPDIIDYDTSFSYHYPLAQGLLVLASLYAAYLILARYRIKLTSPAGLIATFAIIVLGIISVYVSGILAASLVIVIAMANSQRVLLVLGIIALVSYIFWYYYQLDTSLLLKSASMLAVAIGLLLLRWLLLHKVFGAVSTPSKAVINLPNRLNPEERS
jgi:hypothetical protein